MSISKGFRYKDKEGKVTDYEYGVNGSNVTQDANHRLVTDEEKKTWNGKADPEDIPSGSAASYSVANNDTTTQAGFVADARIVKQHGDEIDQLSQNLGGAKIITEGSGAATKYYAQMGADAASKKLLGSKNLTLFKKALIMDGTNVQRYWLFRLEEMDVSSYSSLRVECTDSFQLTCNDIVLSQSGTINLKGIDTISLTLRLNGASNPYYPITVELLV